MVDVRPIDLSRAGLEQAASLLRANFPGAAHLGTEFLDWEYNRNPCGAALGHNAYDGERLVSHCAVLPMKAEVRGRVVRGVLSVNAVTDPGYRGRGLYFQLGKRTYETVAEAGFEFGLGVSNRAATGGWIRHVGFRLLGPLDVRIGFGRPARGADVGVDFRRVWDEASLAWRLACPTLPYRLDGGERFRVHGTAHRWGIEVWMGEFDAALRPPAFRSDWRGRNPLRLWTGRDPAIDWRRSLYVPLPMRLRPSPLNLIYKELVPDRRPPETFRIWAIDFDDF